MSIVARNPEALLSAVSRCLQKDAADGLKLDEDALKRATKRMLLEALEAGGLVVEKSERTIRPDEWPRVGRVDVAVPRKFRQELWEARRISSRS